MLIAGIIPPGKTDNGKKRKPKLLRPYMRWLVDQLLQGWGSGFLMTDIQNRPIIRHAKLLLQMADYPGMCELNLQTSHAGTLGVRFWSDSMTCLCSRLYKVLHQWEKNL